jgi:hypothetical protein
MWTGRSACESRNISITLTAVNERNRLFTATILVNSSHAAYPNPSIDVHVPKRQADSARLDASSVRGFLLRIGRPLDFGSRKFWLEWRPPACCHGRSLRIY